MKFDPNETEILFVLTSFIASGTWTGECIKTDEGDKSPRFTSFSVEQSLTPQICIKQCWNWIFAAVKDGDKCFCSDKIPNSLDITESNKCSKTCQGDEQQTCGSKNTMNVYSTSKTRIG